MASEGEPAEKKQRTEKPRTIEIDLNNFPSWVERASDEELIRTFRIGVTVKDSISIETDIKFRHKNIEDTLTEKINALSEKVAAQTQSGVAKKEQLNKKFQDYDALIKKSGETIVSRLDSNVAALAKSCEDQLTEIAKVRDKPATKGSIGENEVWEILQELTSHTITNVARKPNARGDINVQSPGGNKYLIEVKKHSVPVAQREVNKFEEDVKKATKDFKVGIFFSLNSEIQCRAKGRKFEITYVDPHYFIYVPNASPSKDENLIIWAVLMADELVDLNQNLGNVQKEELEALYEEFQENMEYSKKCKQNVESLERVIKNIKKNLTPFLKVIGDSGKKINAILHPKTR